MENGRLTEQELIEEARFWSSGQTAKLEDCPEARINSQSIYLILPKKLIEILEVTAQREGITVNNLVKQWLDEKLEDIRKSRKY